MKRIIDVWLLTGAGLSRRQIFKLEERIGDLSQLKDLSYDQLCDIDQMDARIARKMIQSRTLDLYSDRVLEWEKKGITLIHISDPAYPEWLRHAPDPPRILYARGDVAQLSSFKRRIAVVGTRHPSPYGREMARKMGRELGQGGVSVVSGMAYGIDAEAHRGALDAQGSTVAVLGSGIDQAYPKSNQALYDELVVRGLVVSEYQPGTPPLRHHFPERNRIVAGLCQGIVVVEAGVKSGALITAKLALEQDRTIFAVPGNVAREVARGPLSLLRDGAYPIGSAGDLMEDMGWSTEPQRETCFDEPILAAIQELGPSSIEELADFVGQTPVTLLPLLSFFEIQGRVTKVQGGLYALNS